LDPDEHEPIVALANRQSHTIAGAHGGGVQLRRLTEHRHQLHGLHSERGDGLVPDEEQVC